MDKQAPAPVEQDNIRQSHAAKMAMLLIIALIVGISLWSGHHVLNQGSSPSTGTPGLKLGAEGMTQQGHSL